MIVTDITEEWIDEAEVRKLFDGKVLIDDDLGLEIVEKNSILELYGVLINPESNAFHKSLQEQFDRKGFLSEKQINCLR